MAGAYLKELYPLWLDRLCGAVTMQSLVVSPPLRIVEDAEGYRITQGKATLWIGVDFDTLRYSWQAQTPYPQSEKEGTEQWRLHKVGKGFTLIRWDYRAWVGASLGREMLG